MILRSATPQDANAIFELHVASISHYCKPFYAPEVLLAWISTKTPDTYKNLPAHYQMIVAENDNKIIGFGVLNLKQHSIDSVYILPNHSRLGIGSALLKKLEALARDHAIQKLTLSSTLNAAPFYNTLGYTGNTPTTHPLKSGVNVECIAMEKLLFSPLD